MLPLLAANSAVAATGDPVSQAEGYFLSGNVAGISRLLFTRYLLAFEVTSALLITAVLGAMVLAHRERLVPKATQRELAIKRIKDGPIIDAMKKFQRRHGLVAAHQLDDKRESERDGHLHPAGHPRISTQSARSSRGRNRAGRHSRA